MNKLGQFAAACVAVVFAFGVCGSLSGETCTYDGGWDVTPSGEADVIVIVSGDLTWDASLPAKVASWTQSGGTVTFQTKYGADPFEVTGDVSLMSGTWTHTANSSAETYRLAVTVGGNFNLGTDATIDVTGCGYALKKGPGFPGGSAGGCYGGIGTNGSDANCYGSVMRPVNLGSGGNHNAGGGAIALTVGGTLTINGAIVCDGYVGEKGRGDSVQYSGGSGGSVLLVANAFAGTGSVSASGGEVSTGYWGAGGRIALVQTGEATDFSAFTGPVHAWPSGKKDMGAGTVYYETAADGYGKGRVVVDRGASAAGSKASVFYLDQQEAEFAPREIALQNGAALKVIGGTRTELEVGAVTGPSDVKLTMTVKDMLLKSVAPAEFVPLTNLTVVVSTGVGFADSLIQVDNGTSMRFDSEVSFDGSVVIGNGSTLTISYPFAVSGDVSVLSGGTITHLANTADTDYRVDLTVGGNLTVAENAGISALAKGWPTKFGPGSGTTGYGGGCHGGRGWNASAKTDGDGVCYGSITKPTELGSGTPGNNRPANGGGSVKLTVAGQVINNGIINANGRGASTENSYVCSPAGSIWITCTSLSGAGRIEANAYGMEGTTSAANYTLSGGGRVAVWLTDEGADFESYTAAGTFAAYGARTSSRSGGAGTVYLKTGSQAENEGTLIIDNALASGSKITTWYTDIGSEVTDAEVGSVIIRNGGYLHMVDGATLTVNGDWTLESTGKFLAEQGGGVAFAGADDSHLSGNTTFSFLSCETPGKTLVFADGSTTTIGASGKLVIAGDDTTPVVLRSETAETAWNLAVDASAEVSVSDADIYDSDASAGAEVVGFNSTATRCTNWSVSKVTKGETITWTGLAGNTGWGIADNWDLKRPPQVSDLVVIPAGAETMPALSGDSAAVSLTVAAGASLDLAGFAFTVTSNLTVQGELQTVGSEIVTAGGDVTFADGAIGALPPALLVLNGTDAQTFDANGNRLVAVLVGNASTAGVTVASSVTANE